MNRWEQIIVIMAALLCLACTTKVSEWVLLNSPAGRYLLVCYHNGAIPETAKQLHRELEEQSHRANLIFREVRKDDGKPLSYALYYDNRLVATYDDPSQMKGITSSPLRKQIASELMDGQLCAMVYLTSGNKEKDEAQLQVVRKSIAASPFSSLIALTVVERNDAAEHHFVQMLLHTEEDLKAIHEPMLFGVFGRFRVLEPLLNRGITGENIGLMIDFFTADCSCVIKDALPGINILIDTSWKDPRPARVNKILDENPHLIHH
ncbi:MAG: hypothetical protein KA780_00075 [Prolixibacteraceae bacterium]|nr:hypothetical protein [Prolixibacteraceae bacterium]